MKIDLSGKRAAVSGSTGGIGLAIAIGLARAGAHVVVNARTQARVTQAMKLVQEAVPGAATSGIASDMATADGAATLIEEAGDIDIVVNNVGTALFKPFNDLTDQDWLGLFELNVMSGVRLTRHYLPRLIEKGWGRIVFISSESALNIPKEMIDYGMTKTAQLAVSRGAAELTAGTQVTVNAVIPGPTRSEGFGGVLQAIAQQTNRTQEEVEAELISTNRPTSLLKRFTTVEEIASMVVYVCSQQASATNGASLRADGGVVRSI